MKIAIMTIGIITAVVLVGMIVFSIYIDVKAQGGFHFGSLFARKPKKIAPKVVPPEKK